MDGFDDAHVVQRHVQPLLCERAQLAAVPTEEYHPLLAVAMVNGVGQRPHLVRVDLHELLTDSLQERPNVELRTEHVLCPLSFVLCPLSRGASPASSAVGRSLSLYRG